MKKESGKKHMLNKLNNTLRKLFIAAGAVFALLKLIESIEIEQEPKGDDYQSAEFDDIW